MYKHAHVFWLLIKCPTESLFVFPCHWNYRPDHCIYGSNCAAAEEHGVYILHGNRGVYHDDKQPAFRAIYEAIQKVSSSLKPYKNCVDSSIGGLFNNVAVK